jgi:DNA-binding response OmpR family regulator
VSTRPLATVAIFNASEDTISMLEQWLRHHGFVAVSSHVTEVKRGQMDFAAFIAEHDPEVIIWDIAPPYDENWKFFKLLRTSEVLANRAVVLTTTHKEHLDRLAGTDTQALEIVGKPYDLDLIVRAVKAALPRADQ